MTEQVKLESICPSCGKTDKLLWPDGCKNTWHIEGCGAMSEIQRYFFEPTMRISNATLAPTVAAIKDGSGTFVLYTDHTAALRERDERITALEAENAELVRKHNEQFKAAAQLAEVVVKLNAENARLSAPVTDADQITFCSYIDPFDGEKEVGNWDSKRIELMIAARKGTA